MLPLKTNLLRGGWRLLNSHNNPFNNTSSLRGNFRFRHYFGRAKSLAGKQAKGIIRDASYILQGGYEKIESDRSDARHGDNYFRYGHIGEFDIEWVPTFVPQFDPETFHHQPYSHGLSTSIERVFSSSY